MVDAAVVADAGAAGPVARGAQDASTGPRRRPRQGLAQGLRVLLGGALPGVAVYVVLVHGWLPNGSGLVLLVAVLVAVPTSPELSRRLASNGSLLLGWVPLSWWVRWPVPVDHGALVVAVGCAVAAASLARSADVATGLRTLVPSARRRDLLIPLGAAAALVAMSRWAFAGTARQALTVMLPGWDNVAHFAMFETIRSHGAVGAALPATPDGSTWGWTEYPQSFHAVAATIGDLVAPGALHGPTALVAYTQSVSVCVVLGLVIVTATLLSLPGLRDRPLVSVAVVGAVWAGYLWEPGQKLLADGFTNFWLACIAVSVALLLAVSPAGAARPAEARPSAPILEAAVVGGLVVFVAHSWAPLLALVAPAALIVALRIAPSMLRRPTAGTVGTVMVVVASALAVLVALVRLVSEVSVDTVVSAGGGIDSSNPMPTLVLVVVGVGVCLSSATRRRHRDGHDDLDHTLGRARLLVLTPLLGVVVASVLLLAQLHTLGTVSYYFVKFLMGLELVLMTVVPAVAGLVVAGVRTRPVTPGVRGALLVLAVVLATTQAAGLVSVPRGALHSPDRAGTALLGDSDRLPGIAAGILDAVATSGPLPSWHDDYLAIGTSRTPAAALFADEWFRAVEGTLSHAVIARLASPADPPRTARAAVPLVRQLVAGRPRARVLVAARYAAPLRHDLGSARLAAQVVADRP